MILPSKLTRRRFISTAIAAPVILHRSHAFAAAEFKRTQAPGYYRFKLGDFEITMLTDGMNMTPVRFSASNIPEEQLKDYLRAHQLPTDQRRSHLNVCLINTGEYLILVDSGSGDNFRDTAGRLSVSLEAAGYARDQIDAVIITHGHPDHIWGIIDDFEEEPRFPKASYFISATEWDYWTADDLEGC